MLHVTVSTFRTGSIVVSAIRAKRRGGLLHGGL